MTSEDLRGRVAVISGGSRGIGRAIAARFALAGAHVVVGARSAAAVAELAREISGQGGRATSVECDLSTAGGVETLVATALREAGGADILVNNVGAAPQGTLASLADKDLIASWSLKLLATIRLIRACVPLMVDRGGGSIVNIIGMAGREPTSVTVATGTTNGALRSLTRALCEDLARQGIAINAISPGQVATGRLTGRIERAAAAEGRPRAEIEAELERAIPTGRFTTPEEVADLALILASRRIPNLTGAEIVLDGGAARSV